MSHDAVTDDCIDDIVSDLQNIFVNTQLATILETHVTPPDTAPEASFIILDVSALINALPSRISKTFEEYAVLEIVPKVQGYSSTYMRR